MLSELLERLAGSPGAYDLLQILVGDRRVQERLGCHVRALPRGCWIVDVGGGTGLTDSSLSDFRYVCLDLDRLKLRRFRARHRGGIALAANATRCPLRTGSVDAVLCTKVTHHLDDAELARVLAETARILKPDGLLIFADAIRSNRLLARLLWRFDRGSHPRTAEAIRSALGAAHDVTHQERFRAAIFHDFVLYVARRTAAAEEG